MATAYRTPGVYIEEVTTFPPSVAAVQTAIPAFIGYTQFARNGAVSLHRIPFRITSLLDYETHFGKAQPETGITVAADDRRDAAGNTISLDFTARIPSRSHHIMHYAMQMYFANDGGPCYIVSVDEYTTAVSDTALNAGLTALEPVDEPTLLVFPEAQALTSALFMALHGAALAQCASLKDRFVIMDIHPGDPPLPAAFDIVAAVNNFRSGIGADNLKYGAAYAPNLETVIPFAIDETRIQVTHNIITPTGTTPEPAFLNALATSKNRVYEGAKAAIRALPCELPPSSAMAGIYARVDNERGVWKAPANVGIARVIKPVVDITARQQEDMNVHPEGGKSVNALRAFSGRGTLVWGARTLAGNDNEWRYISVRRLFNFVEESMKKATELSFVFEPNDANTWVRAKAMCENFLTVLWRQGALQGTKPEHAFVVRVGFPITMSQDDLNNGLMIVEIGMAAVRPAEFIILRFSHKMVES